MERLTPQKETGERRPGDGQAPAGGAWPPAQGHHLSPISAALWKPWSVVFPHCTISVIKVFIHVNLCENYCVQQYSLVYLFFLCELSLFSFLFINVYFFLKTNQCVVDLNVTYSLVSYYRYVIRMDILLGFRMFYKETNS